MGIGDLIITGTMVSLATLMTMGLVKQTKEGFYKIQGKSKVYKSVEDLEKELNKLGYKVR